MNGIVSFAQNHTGIAIVLALGFLFFVYRKPKLFFVLLFLGLFLAGVFYMITSIGGLGSEKEKRLIREEKEQSDNIR
jgi:ABC-type polysaccharide/polyol phosphate export permease